MSTINMDPGSAVFTLEYLPVIEPLPSKGLKKSTFVPDGTALDHDWPVQSLPEACTVQQALYVRDGDLVELGANCTVTSGMWTDPFSNEETSDLSLIGPTYVIPSAEVWRAGGAKWTAEQRSIYASSPVSLVVALKKEDAARNGQSVTDWQPAASSQCAYATRWVAVKSEFGLALTAETERTQLSDMLATCDGVKR